MMDGVRETLCTRCVHREVCKLKDNYLAVVSAIQNENVYVDHEHAISSKAVKLYDFIEIQDPKCKYYINEITTLVR